MHKALLIYNPHSGRRRRLRAAHVEAAAAELRAGGVEVSVAPTRGPETAGEQAREAIAAGCDAIIACGGDGTVHEVLQGMVGSDAALGVIPLGTGNALANDLRLPWNPAAAARRLLHSARRRVPVGQVEWGCEPARCSRYFLTVTGVGADAEMLYRLAFEFKTRWGLLAYYAVAARLWLTHKFVPFMVEFTDPARGPRQEQVTQILAVHITQFGGLLRQLAPGASLRNEDFQLVLFKTTSRLRYVHYMLGVLFQRHWRVKGVETVRMWEVRCLPTVESGRVYVEADGELLGNLPARIRMTGESVWLLTPEALET